MRKVVWLCSWYPSEVDGFIGDFIQRQAQAVSLFADLEVFHVAFGAFEKMSKQVQSDSLTEHIQYVKQKNKLVDYFSFMQVHEFFLEEYIRRKGKPDILHVQIPMKSGLVALRWKKKYKMPFVVTEHYGIYNRLVEDAYFKRNFWFKQMTKRILKQASAFLPVSAALGNDVNKEVLPIPFTSIPNVVNEKVFTYKSKPKEQVFTFIHVSSLTEVKNPMGMLAAIELLLKDRSDFCVRFIGCTNQLFIDDVKSKGLFNSVVFIEGEVEYKEIAKRNQQANAGLLFSHSESQSCVVLEWLCCGLPVISSRVGGVVELIHEKNGILVTPSDSKALAIAMAEMINNYEQYNLEEISKEAIAKYSYEAVGRQVIEVYDSIINA